MQLNGPSSLALLQRTSKSNFYNDYYYFVNDIVVISHMASTIMDNLSVLYCLNKNPRNCIRYDRPDCYLVTNIGLYTLLGNTSGKQKWHMSSDNYVTNAIKNVEGKSSWLKLIDN